MQHHQEEQNDGSWPFIVSSVIHMAAKRAFKGAKPIPLTDQQLLADAQRELQKFLKQKGAKVVTAGTEPDTLTDMH